MNESRSPRGWGLPVFAAVSLSLALLFAVLFFTRGSSELGSVRVIVAEEGKGDPNALTVFVGEAPFVQKDVVSPGPKSSGVVYYPAPYRLPPNLKLVSKDRQYDILAQSETGFTWIARPKLDDLIEDAKKLKDVDALLDRSLELLKERMRPGIVYEDFTWEAKGLRAPIGALPSPTHTQKGKFNVIHGQEGTVAFPLPYAGPPNVEIGGYRGPTVVIVDVTATHFKWKNVGKEAFGNDGEAEWTARGLLATGSQVKN